MEEKLKGKIKNFAITTHVVDTDEIIALRFEINDIPISVFPSFDNIPEWLIPNRLVFNSTEEVQIDVRKRFDNYYMSEASFASLLKIGEKK